MHKILLFCFIVFGTLNSYGQGTFTFNDLKNWWGGNNSRENALEITAKPKFNSTLSSGQVLNTGEKLISDNGVYYLKMQDDGNLCIKKVVGDVFVWCSMVYGFSNATLTMQPDGNLVVHENKKGQKIWKWSAFSESRRLQSGSTLKLSNEGKINIIDPLGNLKWSN